MNKHVLLSKKCASCGIERPLSAFLVLKTQVGMQYGNICSNCRQAQSNKDDTERQDIDETSGTVERHTIDSKTKIAIEQDKKLRFKETAERDFEETTEQEEEKNLAFEKKTSISKEEKKHRQAFLGGVHTKHPLSAAREKQSTRKLEEQKIKQSNEAQQKEQEQLQQEINELNLNAPMQGPTDRLKHQSTTFKRFLAWAGEGSAIAKNLSQLDQKQQQAGKTKPNAEPTIEELTKSLNPSSSRKK